jgi:K319L-like, PKD domain
MDHVATAKFTQEAQHLYTAPHQLIGYEDYETYSNDLPPNVSPALLEAKEAAFLAYNAYDEVCTEQSPGCETEYHGWLERQYVADSETTGVVANAGYAQTVESGETVELNGSRSSDESGAPLTYEWVQTAGPAVELGNETSAGPSFIAPPAEATLSFSLTVSDGTSTSNVDVVHIQVEGPDPIPTAVAGEAQSVASEATVTLDGSGSDNPYKQPLEYEWTQTAGPVVSLSSDSTAMPSFTAPSGPASLTFSLVVTNAAASSTPSIVTVTVSEPQPEPTPEPGQISLSPPPVGSGGNAHLARIRLSRHKVELPISKRARRVVLVLGSARSRVWCTGGLPKGVRRRVVGKRRIVIEANRPAAREVGIYKLVVHIAGGSVAVRRRLAVRLVVPRHRP